MIWLRWQMTEAYNTLCLGCLQNRGHIVYLGSQIARTHHCSSSFSWTQSFALRHHRPLSRLHPPLPSLADCASVHEASVADFAPPPNNRRKVSRFHHRRTSVPSSLRPPSRHFASVALLLWRAHHFQPPSHRNSLWGKFKTCYFFFVLYIFLWCR